MPKFFDRLQTLLKRDERFFATDGNFLRNAAYEAAMKFDEKLLRLLLSDKDIAEKFFVEVDGVKIFNQISFARIVNNRQFFPDSYTRFKNKIGLVDANENFLSASNNVALVFPYKDCVLEGGQTRDDQKREEIFYNTTLAQDEIDRLLAPKVFSAATRFTADGEFPADNFSAADNLIVKGNNLLALASLEKVFAAKVKCIYIDPPYNTGNDGFNYNDSFNHSSWLTFMKNRLDFAKKLLRNDGFLCCQVDDAEGHYLKVLLDEIFGRENYLATIYIQVRYPNKTLKEDMKFHKEIEQIHVYQKSYKALPNLNTTAVDYEKFIYEIAELEPPFEILELGGKKVELFRANQFKIKKIAASKHGLKEIWATGAILDGNSSGRFFRDYLTERYKVDGYGVLYKVHGIGNDSFGYRYFTGPQRAGATKGKYYQGVPVDVLATEKDLRRLPIENFYDFSAYFGNCRHEGGTEFRSGKKPEILLQTLLNYFSNAGDIVMDFFIGSGTTAAVAHKMGRQYIGVEQLDYIKTLTVERLKKVIGGEQGGISSKVNWTGGGSFVYCELAELNQKFIDAIRHATDTETLDNLRGQILETGFISHKVKPADITSEKFCELTLDEQKLFLTDLLDKNLLYVNLCDIDDEEFAISDADKNFTRSFYGEG